MATWDAIIESIKKDVITLFSNDKVNVCEIEIKQHQGNGFHIVKSPRFLCKVKVVEKNGQAKEYVIFVKNRSDVVLEYEKMEKLWNQHYVRQNRYLIPRPLFLDRKNSLLFMENFMGESFIPLLYKKILFQQDPDKFLKQTVIPAAQWLADFQSIDSSEERKPVPEAIFSYKRNVDVLDMLEKKEKKKIVSKMEAVIKNCPCYPETYVHDQYLFRNMLFRDDKICVVDFPNLRRGWPLYDFFRFIIGIDRLAQYPFVSTSLCSVLRESFTSEYVARNPIEYDAETYNELWGLFVVTYIGNIYPRHKGLRGSLNERFIRQTLKKLVLWSKG